MGFWAKSLRIFKCLCEHGKQSVRRLAQKTGLSKSSVHRLQQAMARRGGHPESWWWETEEGRQWFTRLVVATLSTFGLKRGVGMDTMQEFFARLHLATQVGCSPSALRRVMQTLEATILETATTWEKDGVAMGAGQEIIGAVDETFLERIVLILLDLTTGYIVLEETADDRRYATWKALVDQRLDALKAQVRYAEVTYWEARHQEYRQQLDTLSLTLHPFAIDDSAPQTSAQVEARLQAHVEAIEAFAHAAQLPERPAAMTKVKKQLPAVATLVDFWWQGVRQDLEHAAVSPPWQRWAQEVLLPRRYWEHQVTRTRCARRKAKMPRVLERVRAGFDAHVFTRSLPPQALADWQTWATQHVSAFQRASSAVEGRNGALAQLHHHQRGLPKRRDKVWTVLHTFDCRAPDGTTPAARFFRREFPDLFETVLSKINALPRPRKRHQAVAPTR